MFRSVLALALGVPAIAFAQEGSQAKSSADLIGFMKEVREFKRVDEFSPPMSQETIKGAPFHASVPARRKSDGADATHTVFWSYSIDAQSLEIRIEIWPYYHEDLPSLIDTSLRGPYLAYQSTPTGSYKASNQFGAEIDVEKVDVESFALIDDHDSPIFPEIREYVLRLPMAPDAARELTSKLTLELDGMVANDGKPVTQCALRTDDATFSSPIEVSERLCATRVHLERMRLVSGNTVVQEWTDSKSQK